MKKELKMKTVVRQLREKGYRITSQRRLLLDVILENEYSSCKEIYFEVKKKDEGIGIATVYRTVQMLEDMNIINKKMVLDI